jgi:hypothetical protein
MYRYYDDGRVMFGALSQNPGEYVQMLSGIGDNKQQIIDNYYMNMNSWYRSYDDIAANDNRTMIRINAFFMLFSFGSVYVHLLLFMILGFCGIFLIWKTIRPEDKKLQKLLFLLLMFFPSIAFWTSGITKEAVLIFALGGFLFTLKKLFYQRFSIKNLIALLPFFLLLVSMKVYVLLCLIPVIVGLLMFVKIRPFFIPIKFLIITGLFIFFAWNIHHVIPELNLVEAFVTKQHDFIHYALSVDAGSMIRMSFLEPVFSAFLKAMPSALFNTLFRPFFFDSSNMFMFIVSIENLLFVVFLLSISFLYNRNFTPDSFFWGNLFFALLLFVIIGLATPVLGAIVRYKIVGYPFMLTALVAVISPDKLSYFLRKITLKQKNNG